MSTSFRSILRHESPHHDDHGYIQVQGCLEPKLEEPWTKEGLTDVLRHAIEAISDACLIQGLELLDDAPPFTKMRITLESPQIATTTLNHFRNIKLSPAVLFPNEVSTRLFQLTPLTAAPMLPKDIAWNHSGPPKFRRLINTATLTECLEEQRQNTRFLFMTGLMVADKPIPPEWTHDQAMESLRALLQPFDTSDHGIEVFCPPKHQEVRHVHIGMRSPKDAQAVLSALQGQVITWEGFTTASLFSDKLFIDFCDMKNKSNTVPVETGAPFPACTSSTEHVVLEGLHLIHDFVSIEEEQVLLAVMLGPHACWAPPQATKSHEGASVRRRVQHYGYIFDYATSDVLRDVVTKPCPPLPGVVEKDVELENYIEANVVNRDGWGLLGGVLERIRQRDIDGTTYSNINQMTVNEYKKGDGIGSHIDTISAFGDGLLSLSLNSGIIMEFRRGTEKKFVFLPPRSLLALTGPARYEWEHMIVTRHTDMHNGILIPRSLRISLTLRTALELNGIPMPRRETLSFPPTVPTLKTTSSFATPATERDHVHAVYDAIATQWHHTRGKRGVLWPGATVFLQALPIGSVVADVGCGDGKYFPAIWENGCYVIGFDISRPLLKTAFGISSADPPESRRISECRQHLRNRPAVGVADCMSVPLKSKSCDAAICIAVMHHLSTEERRVQCLKELARIVKPGGMINVQAWAMDQEEGSRRRFDATDVFVPFNCQPKYLDKSSDEASSKSVAEQYAAVYDGAEFDEKKGLVVFQRYCHLYRSEELAALARKVDGVEVTDSGFESGNYFIILRVTK